MSAVYLAELSVDHPCQLPLQPRKFLGLRALGNPCGAMVSACRCWTIQRCYTLWNPQVPHHLGHWVGGLTYQLHRLPFKFHGGVCKIWEGSDTVYGSFEDFGGPGGSLETVYS